MYLHRLKNSNEIFYVGKGVNQRAYRATGRTLAWKIKAKEGYTVEIVKDCLSNSEAISLEYELFIKHKLTIVNKDKPRQVTPVEFAFLDELFEISQDSPSGLMWRKDAPILNAGVRRLRGKAAGRLSGVYWAVRLFQRTIRVHRIVYCLHTKENLSVDSLIDHIDGNGKNNNPLNLRTVTYAENARNKKNGNFKVNEETGVIGVSRVKLRTYDYYMAQCRTLDCKSRSKSFNISKYGEDEAFRLACEWRKEQIRLLNEQGAGYTERHGT